ncbi:MAG: glycosyltransferase [Planctomycetaceae bacterium]|nr:glycosyltransferase [Planctomycetaceae bacterium]
MKVTVCVRGRFWAFDLARELERMGALDRLITSSPAALAERFGVSKEHVRALPAYELAARAARRLPTALDRALEAPIAAAFARAAVDHVPAAPEVLVGWSGSSLEPMRRAKSRGALVVLERGSAHIQTQAEILERVARESGLPVRLPPAGVVRREAAEYELADRIAVPSEFVARTFRERGFAPERLIVNPFGVDLSAFAPPAERPAHPRLLCVGRVGARKGSHLLIEAFQRGVYPGELVFVGPIEREFAAAARRAASERVRFLGPVPQAQLPELYRSASAFALASYEEGLAMVLLQAMASGLPLVVSNHTGAEGLFDERDGVLLFPAGQKDALAAQLARLGSDLELGRELGARAAARVSRGFSWSDYGARALSAYRRCLGVGPELPFAPEFPVPFDVELPSPATAPAPRTAVPRSNRPSYPWVPPHRRRRAA